MTEGSTGAARGSICSMAESGASHAAQSAGRRTTDTDSDGALLNRSG
jgi:hypothetical protein